MRTYKKQRNIDGEDGTEQKANGDITNSRAIIDACKPFHWKDDYPVANAPDAGVLQEAKEKFGYLLD